MTIVEQFIKDPLLIEKEQISKDLKKFENNFKDLISDISVAKKKVKIFRLRNNIEITFYGNKLYQIKRNFKSLNVTLGNISGIQNFRIRSNIVGQQNYFDPDRNIELIFDSETGILESGFYTLEPI